MNLCLIIAGVMNAIKHTIKEAAWSITIIIAIQLAMGFVQSSEWYKLESKEFGFKVSFPEKPKIKIWTVDPKLDIFYQINAYICITKDKKDDNLDYFVFYTEYPDSIYNSDNINKDTLQNLYRNAINREVRVIQGKILSERTVNLKGYIGREIRSISNDSLWVLNARFFLAKNNFYIIETITHTEKDFNPSINHFFDSFDFLDL